MPRTRLGVLLLLLTFGLAACGPDEPSHGLKPKGFKSEPVGDAIRPGFAVVDGERFTATVDMRIHVQSTLVKAGRPEEDERKSRAVLELIWTRHQPGSGAKPWSEVSLRYVEAEGAHAEAYRKRAVVTGRLGHDEDGRVKPRSLHLEGGTTEEQLQTQSLIVSMLMAGFGGGFPWIPPRDIRVGESWELSQFIRPRALDNIQRYKRETGLEAPEPTFAGTGVLRGVVEEDGERWLDVEIDALIELAGRIRKGPERGRLSIGDRVTGRALISASRGVPKSFEVTHEFRQRTTGHADIDRRDRTTLRGTVVRTPPAK